MRRSAIGLMLALAILVTSLATEAQQPTKVYRIGILAGSAQEVRERRGHEALQQGLRELGYVEGKNVILEYRYTEGNVALFPELAAELDRSKVDVIVAVAYPVVLAAKQATTTIPIVMVGMAFDPVESCTTRSAGST